MIYIDAHCHAETFSSDHDVLRLYSLNQNQIKDSLFPKEPNYFFVGFHPWWILENPSFDFESIKDILAHPRCLGLGEIGLDRSVDIDFSVQIDWFKKALLWGLKNGVKRFLIHCVRSESDLLGILKELKFKERILLHDFNGNKDQIDQFLKYDSYFSLGSCFKKTESAISKNFSFIPEDRLFLETDDQSERSIQAVYKLMKLQSERSFETLCEQIQKNLNQFLA